MHEEFLTFYADGILGMLTTMTGLALALKATAIDPCVVLHIFSVFLQSACEKDYNYVS
jgi:hypothetical protein